MTEQILFLDNVSILLTEERERKDIVIGAPHHSVGGVKNLPCMEHPDADENSGFIARQIAETLKLSSIIACNYRVDPNKNLRTDYSMQIAHWKPKYLIEIHGHGAKAISDNLIEITAGSLTRNDFSKLFASILQVKLSNNEELKNYVATGDFSKLHFKGTKSATIIDERWKPLQIELPPSLRLNPTDNKLPKCASDLTKYLIETIIEVCK
ncbi:MAG: hypothetical protein KA536_13585 [Saprospiraceae bacterium]|nr:hypothetical protein [Saprospiraceae bacterium]